MDNAVAAKFVTLPGTMDVVVAEIAAAIEPCASVALATTEKR